MNECISLLLNSNSRSAAVTMKMAKNPCIRVSASIYGFPNVAKCFMTLKPSSIDGILKKTHAIVTMQNVIIIRGST